MHSRQQATGIKQMLLPTKANAFLWVSALCMLFGLLFLHWSPAAVLTAYFFETIIIGLLHVVKMLAVLGWGKQQQALPAGKNNNSHPGFLVPFFLVHYFFFVFVQSVFMFLLLQGEVPGIKEPFQVLHNYRVLLQNSDTQQAVALIAFTNLVLALRQFFLPGKYRTATVQALFLQPYVRIFIQQLVVILSGFFMFIPGAVIAAVLLILIRLGIDLVLFAVTDRKEKREELVNALTREQEGEVQAKTREALRNMLDE